MSYKLLLSKLEREAHDLMMDLDGFCATLKTRMAERSVNINQTEDGFELLIKKGTGLDYEKKIYSLRTGEPDISLNTATGRMTGSWSTSKQYCKLPPRVAATIHSCIQESLSTASPVHA